MAIKSFVKFIDGPEASKFSSKGPKKDGWLLLSDDSSWGSMNFNCLLSNNLLEPTDADPIINKSKAEKGRGIPFCQTALFRQYDENELFVSAAFAICTEKSTAPDCLLVDVRFYYPSAGGGMYGGGWGASSANQETATGLTFTLTGTRAGIPYAHFVASFDSAKKFVTTEGTLMTAAGQQVIDSEDVQKKYPGYEQVTKLATRVK